jgi:hypothetical protein
VLELDLWPRYPLFPSGASGEESRMIWTIIAAKAAICVVHSVMDLLMGQYWQ